MTSSFAVDVREESAASKRATLSRVVPIILLDDALGRASKIRYLGSHALGDSEVDIVSFSFDQGESVALLIDRQTDLLASVQAVVETCDDH